MKNINNFFIKIFYKQIFLRHLLTFSKLVKVTIFFFKKCFCNLVRLDLDKVKKFNPPPSIICSEKKIKKRKKKNDKQGKSCEMLYAILVLYTLIPPLFVVNNVYRNKKNLTILFTGHINIISSK